MRVKNRSESRWVKRFFLMGTVAERKAMRMAEMAVLMRRLRTMTMNGRRPSIPRGTGATHWERGTGEKEDTWLLEDHPIIEY